VDDKQTRRWVNAIDFELEAEKILHPACPSDVVHAAAIVNRCSAELIQAALNYHNGVGDFCNLVTGAVRCGASALRFLQNIGKFQRGISETDLI
jgi:hypothetical protein